MKRIMGFIGELRNPIILIVLVLALTFLFTNIRPSLPSVSEPYPPPESGYPAPEATWTFPPLPTDFPSGYVPMIDGATLTPFPNPCEIVKDEPFATPTPLPLAKIVDLAEGLPDNEKYIVFVQRENGLYEKYIIPISSDDTRTFLGLGTNDKIINGYPFVPLPGATPFLTYPDPNPTPTPLEISETIDLAAGIPNEQKCVFVIQRASGIHDQVLIPIDAWDQKDELLQLKTGDTIVNVFPWIVTLTPLP